LAALPDRLRRRKDVAARLLIPPGTNVQTIHAKVYDPGTAGKHSWAIVLKDSFGRILDFGIRASLATAQIKDRQYDGTSWTNTTSPAYWTRYRGGNDYYTMDFTNNADGTVSWGMLYWNPTNTYSASGKTFVTYTNIAEIYLNVMTADNTGSGVTYRWTEFSVSPQIYSPPVLNIAPVSSDVLLSWLSPWSNFVLQANSDLNTAIWTNVTEVPTDDGTNVIVTIPIELGTRFFRLRQ
jgi:hypothetical protein